MRHHPKPKKDNQFHPSKPQLVLIHLRQLSWGLILVLVLVLLIVLFTSSLFSLQQFLCTYNDRPCPPNIEAELQELKGKNILLFRPRLLEDKLLGADPNISTLTVSPQLPHTLKISLNTRVAAFTLSTATNSAHMLVDDQFIPFGIDASPSGSAQIISPNASGLSIGQPITDELIKSALILAHTLNEYFIKFDGIMAQNQHLTVTLNQGPQAIFPMDHDFSKTVTSLQLILRESTIQPKVTEIDLRFTKPVLR